MSDIYMTVLKAFLSIVTLFLITKLIGCRQMSQLNMFDYINGITIGSIAAELAFSENDRFFHILEPNGKLSIFPLTKDRPATPADLEKHVKQEPLPIEIILDGKILTENLAAAGLDTQWLEKQLNNQRTTAEEIFLAVYTDHGKLQTYPRTDESELR